MYATLQDLIDRGFEPELIALTGAEDGTINEKIVTEALIDASEHMDSYIAAKHALPLSTVPGSLKGVCCDIARYFLYKEGVPEELEKKYDKRIAYLRDISKGAVILENSETGQTPQQSDDVVFMGSSDRLFSHRQMKGF